MVRPDTFNPTFRVGMRAAIYTIIAETIPAVEYSPEDSRNLPHSNIRGRQQTVHLLGSQ
jgi:hypothetical protein